MSRRLLLYSQSFCRSVFLRKYCCNNIVKKYPELLKPSSAVATISDISRQRSQSAGQNTLDDNVIFEVDDDLELDGSIRVAVQYDTTDPVISSLLACDTVQNVLDIIEKQRDDFKKEYQVQAILMARYLQRAFVKVQTQMGIISDVTEADFVNKLKEEPQFQFLLEKTENSAASYNVHELTCALLYLCKLEIDLRSPTMQALISEIEKRAKSDPASVSLPALSRTCVALKSNGELWSQSVLLNLIPIITAKIDEVATPEEFRLLTICLLHTHHLLPKSCLFRYKELCHRLLDQSLLTSKHDRALVKAVTFLSIGFWSNENVDTVRQIGRLLENRVAKLEIRDAVALNKALQMHLEPASLVEEVVIAARDYLVGDIHHSDRTESAGILASAVQFSSYTERKQMEKLLYKELKSDYFLPNMISLFQVLRSLKTSDQKLCHMFWSKTIDSLRSHHTERDPQKLYRVAHRYMYFNNNMGGTYRHFGFENQMVQWIWEEIETGSTSISPTKMAGGVSFILAYSQQPHLLIEALDKILSLSYQLSKIDCIFLSRGVEIMMELMKRKQIHPDLMQRLVQLDTCMNECAWRHLNDTLTISDLIALLRTYYNRRASPESLLFHTIVQRLVEAKDPLNSRLIRDFSHSMNGLNYLIPSVMDRMAEYIVRNEETVMAETAERLLHVSFHLGYTPAIGKEFLETCSRLVTRDKDRLSSLCIIQMCLALSYFHSFPEELVSFVFAVDFLERIDEELAVCYSKATYPVRVRHALMELNRSVCLDLPQLDVPWFHTKYCQELASLDPEIMSMFHKDVGEQLANIVKDMDCIQTGVYSPYGYKINFLVHLDAMTRPLKKHQTERAKEKVAFILHSDRQFTSGEIRLKGQQKMRQRHLEMLGYRVIPIAESVWNAMYLTEDYAKRTFLAEKLWPER